MTQEDFRRCQVTLPDLGLVIDGLLVGDEIHIRQANQVVRLPGRAPELQQVIDGILSVNATLTREDNSRRRQESLRVKPSERPACDGNGNKPSL